MVFSEISFVFFLLPVFLALDFAVHLKTYLRNMVVVCISLIFYFWDGSHYFHILIIYGVLNYLFGFAVAYAKEKLSAKLALSVLFIFISLNLYGLFFFKYLYWLLTSLQNLLLNNEWLQAVSVKDRNLPLGISFFTFHALSYLIDIYRKEITVCKSPLSFLTYFFMFPHLVAGPIVRFKHVKDELQDRPFCKDLFCYGLSRFIMGLNKKILIANSAAPIASTAFLINPELLSSYMLWLGAIAFMVQIYFDFSAYSDMAIGLAAMAGFRFHENFNAPYHAVSMRDFWRRWHISLSSWLRDYVYIPLGGSRVPPPGYI